MTIFQRIYDWLASLNSPEWFIALTRWLQDHVIVPTLKQIGKDGVTLLQNLIMEAKDKDWTNTKKLKPVIGNMKTSPCANPVNQSIQVIMPRKFHRLSALLTDKNVSMSWLSQNITMTSFSHMHPACQS